MTRVELKLGVESKFDKDVIEYAFGDPESREGYPFPTHEVAMQIARAIHAIGAPRRMLMAAMIVSNIADLGGNVGLCIEDYDLTSAANKVISLWLEREEPSSENEPSANDVEPVNEQEVAAS